MVDTLILGHYLTYTVDTTRRPTTTTTLLNAVYTHRKTKLVGLDLSLSLSLTIHSFSLLYFVDDKKSLMTRKVKVRVTAYTHTHTHRWIDFVSRG